MPVNVPPLDDRTLFKQACDKVDRGDVNGARVLLGERFHLWPNLEEWIQPKTATKRLSDAARLGELAALYRGKSWVEQLDRSDKRMGPLKFSIKLTKPCRNIIDNFLGRVGNIPRPEIDQLYVQFLRSYSEALPKVRESIKTAWDAYQLSHPRGVRFLTFLDTFTSANSKEPRRLTRYERDWVI